MTKAKNSIARAVGQKIQVLRKDHGITAARLAEMIEISQQQMSRYERGVNRVDVDCLVRIADIFEVPVGWFFTDIEGRSKRDGANERESWKADTAFCGKSVFSLFLFKRINTFTIAPIPFCVFISSSSALCYHS